MTTPRFIPSPDEGRCHALHLHGLVSEAPWVQPSYVRRDSDLRRSRPKTKPAPQAPGYESLDGVLAIDVASTIDANWFQFRWSLGESESAKTHAARLADEANQLPVDAFFPEGPIAVTASPVMQWGYGTEESVVVAGYLNSGYMVALAAVGAQLRPHLPTFPELTPGMQHRIELHVAASACLRLPAFADHVDKLLETAGGWLRPARGSEKAAQAEIDLMAEICLKQPPGEVGRIASGLYQGRVDRLHRAWERGFFVPKGFDLDEWASSVLGISCPVGKGSVPYTQEGSPSVTGQGPEEEPENKHQPKEPLA